MKMTRKMLKARIRVLESDLDEARTYGVRRLTQLDDAQFALHQIGKICTVITARAIKGDEAAVGDFAWVTLTTPTLIMLAGLCKDALEGNLKLDDEAAQS